MKILITGCAGFIGYHLSSKILQNKSIAEYLIDTKEVGQEELRLLELDTGVKKMVETRKLDMGHARALLPLTSAQQLEVASKIVKQDLSVRATENLVKQLLDGGQRDRSKNGFKDTVIQNKF